MVVPAGARVPWVYAAFDSSRALAKPTSLSYDALVIGQKLSSGTASANTRYRVNSSDHAGILFGYGSHVHLQCKAWFKVNKRTRLWAIGLADNGSGVASVRKYDVVGADSGAASADGFVYLYIAGVRYEIPFLEGDTEAEIVNKMIAKVNADASCPFTASNGGGGGTDKFWLTAKNKGVVSESLDVRFNYREGEAANGGVTISSITGVTGATDPDVGGTIIPLLADQWYQIIVSPYADSTTTGLFDTELESRFGPTRQIDGRYFFPKVTANHSDLETFGLTLNSKHLVCTHGNGSPSPHFEFSAQTAAWAAVLGEEQMQRGDAAAPFTGLELIGILPPAAGSEYDLTENDALLHDGITTWTVDSTGKVRLQRVITTYRKNSVDAPDEAYLDLPTLQVLMYLRYDFRNQILLRYPRAKLAKDSARLPSGQQFMTPMVGKAEAIAIFRGWEERGYVENIDQFIEDLTCEIDSENPNQLNWSISPDLVNMFLIGGVNIQFLLN